MTELNTLIPEFRSGGRALCADACEPLRKAAKAVGLRAASRGQYPGQQLPDHWIPEVRSMGLWDARNDQSWGLDWHRNEGIEITYLDSGRLWFETDTGGTLLRHGDLTLSRPWQQHRVGRPNITASRLYWIILDVGVRRPNQSWRWPDWLLLAEAQRDQLTRLLRQTDQPVWTASDEVRDAFHNLGQELSRPKLRSHDSWFKLHINRLMLVLTEMLCQKNPVLNEQLCTTEHAVRLFLNDLPSRCAEQWSVDSMARECGLGRTRFIHYCLQLTNQTPIEYLTSVRLDRAKMMLATMPHMTVTQIAVATGFCSSQYFATVFRRHMHQSPGEFTPAHQTDQDRG